MKTHSKLNRFEWLDYLVQLFQFARQEDRSAVWGLIGAVFPTLVMYDSEDNIVQKVWQKLLAIDALLRLDPIN